MFVFCLFGSNLLWANSGQIELSHDVNNTHSSLISEKVNSGEYSPVSDEHEDGHDCHMSAHFIAINSDVLPIIDFSAAHDFTMFNAFFLTNNPPPPSKPPRS